MNPENLKEKALRFIGTSPGIRFGSFGVPSFTKGLNIKTRRSIPQDLIQRISNNPQEQNLEETISASQGLITNLGKITLNLEQTKNNLDRIVEVIQEDYKISKDQNKKEVEEYRKRIANRGRLFGKKEIADKKTGAGFDVKKYVGSFFSNSGPLKTLGALSLLNLFEAILSGDISKIVGPLLALVSVYVVPKVIGLILKQLGKNVLRSLFPRAIPRGVPSPGAAVPIRPSGSPGKFFGKAALLAGGLTLGGQLLDSQNQGDATEQRLEELTQEQKALVAPNSLVPVPQDDLKRFEQLNKKFEEALDFLLKKQKEDSAKSKGSGESGRGSGRGGPGGAPASTPLTSLSGDLKEAAQTIIGYESANSGGYNAMNRGTGGDSPEGAEHYFNKKLTDMSIGDVIDLQSKGKLHAAGAYQFTPNTLPEAMTDAGLKSSDKFNERNQDLMFANHFRKYGPRKWTGNPDSKQSQKVISRLDQLWKNVKNAPVAPTLPPPAVLPAPPGETYPSIGGYSPVNESPIINLIPVTSTEPTSMSGVDGNDQDIPAVNTFYSGNFLSFYSKLTYQIV